MHNKTKILALMSELPADMVEEYNECNFLPYKVATIEGLVKFFNRKLSLNLSLNTFGYTEEISSKIDEFYHNLDLRKLG